MRPVTLTLLAGAAVITGPPKRAGCLAPLNQGSLLAGAVMLLWLLRPVKGERVAVPLHRPVGCPVRGRLGARSKLPGILGALHQIMRVELLIHHRRHILYGLKAAGLQEEPDQSPGGQNQQQPDHSATPRGFFPSLSGSTDFNPTHNTGNEAIIIGTLLLIDGGLIFRNFFALPPMTDPQGRPVGAVYGFAAMTLREIRALRPTHIAVAMDVPIDQNRRTHIFADYKGNRPECPAELAPQFGLLREVLDALSITWLQVPGYEADDIMGTMSRKAERSGLEVSLLTGDRDALQLLSAQTQVRYTRKLNDPDTYDPARFMLEYNLEPLQLIDLKGLAGDASDNIPGIRGIGEKTAMKLLQEFGSLEAVLANAHTQKGRLRERLESGGEIARLCKQLATIEREMPNLPDPGDCALALNRERGRAKFEELRFRSLLVQLAG